MDKLGTHNIGLLHQKCSKHFTHKFTSAENLFLSKLSKKKNKKFLFFHEESL